MRNHRLVVIVAVALQLIAGHAAAEGTFFKNRKPAEAPAAAEQTQPQPQAQPTQAPEPAAAPTAAEVAGPIDQVVTTDTIVVGGTQVQLYGVAGEGSPYVEALAQWLVANGNELRCEPQGGRYRCFTPGGVDVGGVVIVNGVGKASADAPPEYQTAVQEAQAAMRGVWRQ